MMDTRSRSKSRKQTPSPTNRVTKNTAQNNKSKSSNSTSTRNALSSKRLPELKELCESYKVSSTGTRSEIIRRLLEHTNNGHLGDAIVVAEVHIPDELRAMQEIKAALVDIINKSSFLVREVHGRTFICNEEGLNYATAKMSEPEDKYNLEKSKERIDHLESLLTPEKSEKAGQWDDVRSRVISTFKRDSNTADANDMSIIDRVNKSIHHGNVVSDAGLYGASGSRTDESAYERLYGLLPEEVNKIGKSNQRTPVERSRLTLND